MIAILDRSPAKQSELHEYEYTWLICRLLKQNKQSLTAVFSSGEFPREAVIHTRVSKLENGMGWLPSIEYVS
jgi:hypothetical protein